jgi:hypothetical protein
VTITQILNVSLVFQYVILTIIFFPSGKNCITKPTWKSLWSGIFSLEQHSVISVYVCVYPKTNEEALGDRTILSNVMQYNSRWTGLSRGDWRGDQDADCLEKLASYDGSVSPVNFISQVSFSCKTKWNFLNKIAVSAIFLITGRNSRARKDRPF